MSFISDPISIAMGPIFRPKNKKNSEEPEKIRSHIYTKSKAETQPYCSRRDRGGAYRPKNLIGTFTKTLANNAKNRPDNYMSYKL
jgi:hypothetical protein